MTTLVAIMFMAAATTFGQGIGVGLKGGLNFAKLDASGASSKTGFHLGAFAKLMITDKIGIQPEAFYSIQGSNLDAGTISQELNINYLQVPVLLRFNPISILNIHAGPQFGILLKAESDSGGVTTNIKDDLKNSDFAIAVGAGLDLPMGLSLALRYVKGVSEVADDSSDKNNMFQISVGYQLFGLGK